VVQRSPHAPPSGKRAEEYKQKAESQEVRDDKGQGILSGFARTEFEKLAGLRSKKADSWLQKRSRSCWMKVLKSFVVFPAPNGQAKIKEVEAEVIIPRGQFHLLSVGPLWILRKSSS
jgi:hypothetical protein